MKSFIRSSLISYEFMLCYSLTLDNLSTQTHVRVRTQTCVLTDDLRPRSTWSKCPRSIRVEKGRGTSR